jgi:hypothetical protein
MEKKLTLLEIAKKTKARGKPYKEYKQEEIELALAWVKGEVNMQQIQKALGLKNAANSYSFLVHALKYYIRNKIFI